MVVMNSQGQKADLKEIEVLQGHKLESSTPLQGRSQDPQARKLLHSRETDTIATILIDP